MFSFDINLLYALFACCNFFLLHFVHADALLMLCSSSSRGGARSRKKSNVESFAAIAKPLSILAKLSILDVGGVLATPVLYLCSEALVQRCSVKKVFLEISQNVL